MDNEGNIKIFRHAPQEISTDHKPQTDMLIIDKVKDTCPHEWKVRSRDDKTKCSFYPWYPSIDKRFSYTIYRTKAC